MAPTQRQHTFAMHSQAATLTRGNRRRIVLVKAVDTKLPIGRRASADDLSHGTSSFLREQIYGQMHPATRRQQPTDRQVRTDVHEVATYTTGLAAVQRHPDLCSCSRSTASTAAAVASVRANKVCRITLCNSHPHSNKRRLDTPGVVWGTRASGTCRPARLPPASQALTLCVPQTNRTPQYTFDILCTNKRSRKSLTVYW